MNTETHDPFSAALRADLHAAAGPVHDSCAFIAEATGRGRSRLRRQRRTRWGVGSLAAVLLTAGAVGGVHLLEPAPLGLSVAGPVLGRSEPAPTPLKTLEHGEVQVDPAVTAAAADTVDTVVEAHLPGWSAGSSVEGWRLTSSTNVNWKATSTATSPAVTLQIEVSRDAAREPIDADALCHESASCFQQTLADGSFLTVGTRQTLVQLGSMPEPARPVEPFAALDLPDGRKIGVVASIAAPDIPVDSVYPPDSPATADALRAIATDPRLQALTIPAPQ
ncbi:hypothetical protein [Kineococcus rhizosphaerae]|uniref:Uncharacterized protein n=1 Tax=Kineococcus rhizosphaerae TaxID=559628 RepID=A0A2T0QX73_9ACTN|nr:hypothetical protein [Kineococcus rhizosphaerae]PRY10484.1 hypothetical protein CLV37_11637 [Kineococcus rhizosphaerae]